MKNEYDCFSCFHRFTREEIVRYDVRDQALKDGDLVLDGDYACEIPMPFYIELFNAQNITCHGPNHPSCPDPKAAKPSPKA